MQTLHYHVLAGFHGCIPESNIYCASRKEAREELKHEVKDLRESKNRLTGNLKSGYFEITKKTDALCDYLEISECMEKDCFKEMGLI